jgi:cytochrome P450
LRAFLTETLRLRTPVPGVDRTPVVPTEVGGVSVAPGTDVLLLFQNMHMDERYFKNAKEFLPERWLSLNQENSQNSLDQNQEEHKTLAVQAEREKNPWIFLPFSGGERNCIGQKTAMQEATIFLCLIVKQFEISSKNWEETKMFMDPVLSPFNLRLRFTNRNK